MQDLKVSFIQANLIWENKASNLSYFADKIRGLNKKTDLIVLPEMFTTAFSMKPELFAELPESETHRWMAQLSEETNSCLAGSYMVNVSGNYFNRFVIMYPNGQFLTYDKRHLFRMGKEHHHFTAGEQSLIFECQGWKIKALICYDLRFPVFSKNNYKQDQYDYDALIYVANWPKVRNNIWKNLLVARAIENQAYVIGVNRIGKDGNGLDHAGSSCVIDPRGEYCIAPTEDTARVASTILSMSKLEDFRNKFTVGLDWDRFELL